ncbi:response regulator transcription factor [Irregularibacter muris]|uniref:Stage 0 sporulation protein A homolog n=1 Tax=Irregularibacter muris TaxID=1796619 RepID=A0AAE3KZL9_9FIRM|nr:response regulator transcription factor [Irregularibacter muris]MCR1898487.1 response regulator transcription factor [Irregularibacter muris]
MKILILEDDSTIAFAIQSYMKRFEIKTDIFDSLEAISDIDMNDYDLAILDVNLPDGSGFEYLKYIREYYDIPVVMLTVRDSEENILTGFDYGADEYITKPFSLPILKARMDNIFKRRSQDGEDLTFQELVLDSAFKTARINNKNIELNRQEFDVLEIFLLNKGLNITREHLIDSVWGYNLYEINDNTLTVTIKRLRNKLGTYGDNIKTVRGIGYRWESEKL